MGREGEGRDGRQVMNRAGEVRFGVGERCAMSLERSVLAAKNREIKGFCS